MQRKLTGGNGASFGLKPSGTRSGATKAKMVIKPFKVKPQLPEDFEEQTWQKLQQSVVAIFTNQPAAASREELYRAVEDLCIHKMAPKLYERLEATAAARVAAAVGALAAAASADPRVFLEQAGAAWADHTDRLLTVRNVFLYLDRGYVLQAPGLRGVWDLGLHLFRAELAARRDLQQRLLGGLLNQIEAERNGEDVNRALLKSLLRALWSLGLYRGGAGAGAGAPAGGGGGGALFEDRCLAEAALYYQAEGQRVVETSDAPHFLAHCERRLAEEAGRCGAAAAAVLRHHPGGGGGGGGGGVSDLGYLDPGTLRPLVAVVEERLVAPHAQALIDRGFAGLMAGAGAPRVADLRSLYGLLRRPGVAALPALKQAFNAHLRKEGLALVSDDGADAAKTLVERLLSFRDQAEAVLVGAFNRDPAFAAAVKDAWEHFLNVKQNRPAELLAKYVDSKLRGQKGSTDTEVEATLDKVMVVFRYLHAKDVFEAFYKKDLAKRLLLGKSASFDLERAMISKLKTECGAAFTTKLEGMFKDIDLSRDLMAQYTQYQADRDASGAEAPPARPLEMAAQVLTTGYWPTYPPMELRLPPEIVFYQERFRNYYTNKYQGRRIEWQHFLGQCIVKANCFQKKKELSVSQLQTMVLVLFNEANSLIYEEILEQTGIEAGELRRTLQSLACGKARVLRKEPKGKEVADDDAFTINQEFTHKLYRIRINTIQLKETVEENEKTHEAVFRDRQYQVDAAIVRIMKSRKTLGHTQLMGELMSQLKFPAKPVDLKKRIESLIEREYLERDEDDSSRYNYLA